MESRPQPSTGPGDPRSDAVAAKLAERRRRVRAIRTRVAGLSVAGLMATSGIVVVQLVSGNDPALAQSHKSTQVSTAADRTTTRTNPSTVTTSSGAATTTTAKTTKAHTHRTRRHATSAAQPAASTPSSVTTSAS